MSYTIEDDYDSADEFTPMKSTTSEKHTLSRSIRNSNDLFANNSNEFMIEKNKKIKDITVSLWDALIQKGHSIDNDTITMMQNCEPKSSDKCITYNKVLQTYMNKHRMGGTRKYKKAGKNRKPKNTRKVRNTQTKKHRKNKKHHKKHEK